jgi:hypothetical protein
MLQVNLFLSKNIKIMEYAMSNVGTHEEVVVDFTSGKKYLQTVVDSHVV